MQNDEIIKKVINGGKLYPRPVDMCDQCNDKIILCWGALITQPYWRHLTSGHNNHTPNSESFNHKFAKKILVEYLNKKTNIDFKHICNNNIISIPKEVIIFKEEVTYKNCRFDIGGFDNSGNLKFGIEVLHAHKTVNIKTRNDIIWVEAKANDIIFTFDNCDLNTNILINDYSEKQCCGEQLKNLSLLQIAQKLGYMEEYNKNLNDVRNIMIVLYGKYYMQRTWNTKGLICECKDSDCDYCNNIIKNKKNKKYLQLKKDLWEEFINRSKCMKCEKKWNLIEYRKPFCFKCYKKIMDVDNGGEHEEIEIKVDESKRNKLKKKFIERTEKINKNIYDFLDNEQYVCCGYPEIGTGCIILSLNINNDIIVSKNPNYKCEYNCKLCKNFLKKEYDYCDRLAAEHYLDCHGGQCVSCGWCSVLANL